MASNCTAADGVAKLKDALIAAGLPLVNEKPVVKQGEHGVRGADIREDALAIMGGGGLQDDMHAIVAHINTFDTRAVFVSGPHERDQPAINNVQAWTGRFYRIMWI